MQEAKFAVGERVLLTPGYGEFDKHFATVKDIIFWDGGLSWYLVELDDGKQLEGTEKWISKVE
jgi:hypothetical protein